MHLKVNKLSEHTGLEILNLNLNKVLDKNTLDNLRHEFIQNSVLVIRNQNLSSEGFYKSSQIFGKIFEQHIKKFALKFRAAAMVLVVTC